MSEIVYEIVKKVGVLSRSTSGWAKTPIVPAHFVGGTRPPNQIPI